MVLGFTRDSLLGIFGLKLPVPLLEIVDIIIISLALGYIFKDFFRKPAPIEYDPLTHYKNQRKDNFKFAILVTAPAVVLHELGHKVVAMIFGVPSLSMLLTLMEILILMFWELMLMEE